MTMRFTHVNLVANDWRKLADFYRDALGCVVVPPERDLSGEWLERVTGVAGAHIVGAHLLLPGYGAEGPTLEIFQYEKGPDRPPDGANVPGYAHIAFAVDDVEATADRLLAHGARAFGALTHHAVESVGILTVQYLADPEGNLIELQHWQRSR
jgi:catechol 2,3-dioxygenase-like lactoylglutathione lyase family enzyme